MQNDVICAEMWKKVWCNTIIMLSLRCNNCKSMKKVLFIVAAMLVSAVAEVRASEPEAMDAMPVEAMNEVTLTVSGNSIVVNGGNGLTLEVFTITGEQVMQVAVDSDSKSVTLRLQRGCYIVRVGKVTRKISIR